MKEGETMKQQQTKKGKLEDLFYHARMDLPREMFTDFLVFAFGVFEHVAGANRPINKYDVTLIAMELETLRKKSGFVKRCIVGKCERPALDGLPYCKECEKNFGEMIFSTRRFPEFVETEGV